LPPIRRFTIPTRAAARRGGRGIILLPDELFVASYHTLHGFDYQLRPTRSITNPNFAGVHELKLVDDGIWVCSTRWARFLKVGFDGKSKQEWWARMKIRSFGAFAAPPLTVDKTRDNRVAY